jgi:hypothetical protein
MHPPPGPIARAVWLFVDLLRSPVVIEGDAWFCDWDHGPLIAFVPGPDIPSNPAPLHVDVRTTLSNRGPQLTTVTGVKRAVLNGESLVSSDLDPFEEVTLEPGGARETRRFTLARQDGGPVNAKPGDNLKLVLRLTRGGALLGAPRRRLKLAASAPD